MAASSLIGLVADDDEYFRVALSTILTKQLDFPEVIEAASLDEAIERLGDNGRVLLALFDLSMPGMQAPANLRAVRECFPKTRVAVVSASESRRDILGALEAGVHGYIPKSSGVSELTAAVRTVLDGRIYVPPSLAIIPSVVDDVRGEPAERSSALPVEPGAAITPRQRDVLELLVKGKSNKEIARALGLGGGTIKVHLTALFRNLSVSNRAAAAVAGIRLLRDA